MDTEQGFGGPLRELALFAGAGGGLLAGKLLGWKTVCAVELNPYAAGVLVARQNEGFLEPFPIWDDVRTFEATAYRGIVDVISGGFPCQDLSVSWNGKGIEGKRSGLWFEMCRIVKEAQPRFVFIENVQNLRSKGLDVLWKSLAKAGYSCRSGDFYASDLGAPHLRKRTFVLAFREWTPLVLESDCEQCECCGKTVCAGCGGDYSGCSCPRSHSNEGYRVVAEDWGLVAYPDSSRLREQRRSSTVSQKHISVECNRWWSSEPDVGRVADRVPARVDRLKAIGNAQVPAVDRLAWQVLYGMIRDRALPSY
jgi:DNA (cytosine-5)-methyltransferase 1